MAESRPDLAKSETAAPCSVTISDLPFSYFHLSLIRQSTDTDVSLDLITVRTYMTSALQQFLGLTGTSIDIDILKIDKNDVWIRLPRADRRATHGALSQWMGKSGDLSWRIKGVGDSLAAVSANQSRDLFRS